MKTNNNIPAYRFQGYTDAWELRKLGDEVYFYNGRAYKQSELLDFGKYKVVRVGNFNTNEKWYYSNLELEDSKTIDTGDLIYLWATSFGPEIWKGSKSIYHYHIWKLIIQQVEKIDKNYLYMWLYQDKKKIAQNTNGSTMVHITKKMIESRDFMFPTLPEQKAIGTFFSTLDRQITLHQRKLDTLKEQKKTYLKLLFPAKGQTKPALRFQGFDDDWNEVKLGEISTHRGGTAIEKHFSEDGKYKVISIGSYGLDNKYVDQNIRAVENEVTRSRVVNKNELTMVLNDKTANGNIIGRCLLIETDDEFVINQRTEIIGFDNEINPKFAYVVLNGVFREQVKKIVQGGTQIYVNYSSVEQLSLSHPSIPEQEAIGTFFQTLDQEISQVEDKLASLKEMKKTFLRKLFVS